MYTEGKTVHLTATEASAGSREGVVRWVLIVGTLLAIVLLSIIWISGSAGRNGTVGYQSVSDKMQTEAAENHASDVLLAPSGAPSDQVTHQNGLTVEKNDAKPEQ